jgi:hypothetical protein
VMSTKSKRKHKRSDIEAKDRNKTKTFWCVPEPKVERFYLFQKFWDKTKTFWCVPTFILQKQNVSIYSKNFGTKPKLFDVFQLFLAKAKRYYVIQKILSKTKTFWFSSQISKTRTELFEVSKKIWKLKKSIAFGPKILRSERERFGSTMNFV